MSITQSRCQELEDILRQRIGSQIHNLRVDLCETGWIVSGSAESFYIKQLVTEAIREHSSNRSVNNVIGVTRMR